MLFWDILTGLCERQGLLCVLFHWTNCMTGILSQAFQYSAFFFRYEEKLITVRTKNNPHGCEIGEERKSKE